MKAKQVYDSIDQSKATKEVSAFLEKVKTATKNFTVENEAVDKKMNELYEKIKATKPDILKGYKEPKAATEPKAPRATTSKPKTTRAKKSNRKPTVSSVAKKIRKKGESWNDALKRAGSVFKEQQEDKRLKSRAALQELENFMNDDKFKNWPRTYGKEKASANDLVRDNARKAKAPGKRISKSGRVYWENRDNRSDREASDFPRKIYLKEGGELMAPTRSLFELGGEVNVEPTILQNNPNYLTSTESMDSMFAKGGKLKYDPSRDVEAIVIVDGSFNLMFMKGDFIGGAYQMEQGGLAKDYIYVSPRKIIFARLKSGEDIKPVNGFWVKKNATGTFYTGAKPKKGFSKISKFKVPRPIIVTGAPSKNDKIMKLLGEFSGKDFIRPGQSFVKVKDGQLVSTNSHYLIRLIDKSTEGVDELVCESRACKGLSNDETYPNFEGVLDSISVDFSESYNLVDLYEQLMAGRENVYAEMGRRSKSTYIVTQLKLKNNVLTFDSGLLLQCVKGALELGWKNAFISYQDAKNKAILLTEDKVATGTMYRVLAERDVILLMPIMSYRGDFEYEFDAEAEEAFELGGQVMVQPTILQNNPDYITSTATMSELFAKGGYVDVQANLMKELQKLQRELNSPRLSRYTEGDDSQEEIARKRERASKLNRFNEILDLLRELESKKMAEGGIMGKGGAIEASQVRSVISKVKKDLMKKWQQKGGYENFGVKEGEMLREKFNFNPYGSSEEREIAQMIQGFENWAMNYDGNEKMAEGGYVAVSENNGYWYIMSTPSSKEKAQQVIDMGVPRGEVGKVVTLEQAKAYNKVIGREYLEKGGGIYSSDKAWSVKVMLDDQPVDSFMVRGRNLKEARMMVEDYHEAKMEAKYGDDIYFEIEEAMADGGLTKNNYQGQKPDDVWNTMSKGQREKWIYFNSFLIDERKGQNKGTLKSKEMLDMAKKNFESLDRYTREEFENQIRNNQNGIMAKGGALEHMIFKGDKIRAIHRNMVIVESDLGSITVLDFRTEPLARRILVEPITGKNTVTSAIDFIDADPSFKTTTMAMGGSLYTHGLEEGDLIVEDEGAYINVLSEDGKIYYVDLGKGERSTEPPLPFEHGGEVKIGDIARLAAMYNKTGQEVAAAISEGADVEVEHTEDRKRAMRIAVDHLNEDFYYYAKLKAVENKPDFSDYYEKGGAVPEQFLDSKGVRKIDPKSIKELTDFVMALPQTKSVFFNESTGEYVPSRRKLHAEIINTFKKDVVCITKGQPIAIFMGGSPASGKSSFLRKYSPYLLKEEILKVDADEIRAMLPEYQGYNASQTHSETKDIVSTLLSNKNIGIPCDFDLIYDGTMNSVKSYIPLMDILRKRGYKIFIVYMDKVPKDVIIKRALERYQKSGRFVPLEVIEDFFEKGRAAFDDLKKDVDGYMVIDGSNQDYEIIEQGGVKLPTNRKYSKLGTKINPKDIPVEYKRGGMTKKA
jgi:predicted ABC-type ATPase/cell division septum initiation protein DivIVA